MNPSKLTLHLHDLVRVLNDLVLGLVAEGVCPGLDQVEDLVAHVRLGLLLGANQNTMNPVIGNYTGDSTLQGFGQP